MLAPTVSIRYLPTRPLELADAGVEQDASGFEALAARTTTRALAWRSVRVLST